MCDEQVDYLGEHCDGNLRIYRACTRAKFLNEVKDAVAEAAFWKESARDPDGLSFGTTAQAAVSDLNKYYGIISISVADIRSIDRNLEVRYDMRDRTHILLRNVPCQDKGPQEKADGLAVASELAPLARVESNQLVKINR